MKYRYSMILLSLILAGCGVAPLQATPFPTPEIWSVDLDPALDWLRPDLSECTQNMEGISIVVDSPGGGHPGSVAKEFNIVWDSPDQIDGYAYILGWDELAIVVNKQNPLESLAVDDLQMIFEGKIKLWSEISGVSTSLSGEIQVWTYPPGDEVQNLFETIFGLENYQNPFAFVAPNPEAMLEAIKEDPLTIGILPARWIASGVNKVLIVDAGEEEIKKPILVIARSQPGQKEKDWLLCLMGKIEE
jgi:hypothetical protein